MKSRLLNDTEINQAKALAGYSFQEKEFADWFFDRYVQAKQLVGGFTADNKLECMLCLSPYTLQLNGQNIAGEYVTTVTTAPESRGLGYFKPLLHYAFEHLRQLGTSVVILKAIESKLYTPFDFAFCYNHLRYSMPLNDLQYFAKSIDLTLVNATDYQDHLPLIMQLYNDLGLSKYNAIAKRSEQNWHNLLTVHKMDGGHIMLALCGKKPVGYMLYYVRNGNFEIFEMFTADKTVQSHFLNMAHQHRTQAKNFFWRTAVDNLAYLDMNISQYNDSVYPQLAPFMMVRILDAAMLLRQLPVSQSAHICITISDPFLACNNRTLSLTANKGQLEAQDTTQKADVHIDIATLAQLIFGAYSVDELIQQDKLQLINPKAYTSLAELFPKQTNYINEEF